MLQSPPAGGPPRSNTGSGVIEDWRGGGRRRVVGSSCDCEFADPRGHRWDEARFHEVQEEALHGRTHLAAVARGIRDLKSRADNKRRRMRGYR